MMYQGLYDGVSIITTKSNRKHQEESNWEGQELGVRATPRQRLRDLRRQPLRFFATSHACNPFADKTLLDLDPYSSTSMPVQIERLSQKSPSRLEKVG